MKKLLVVLALFFLLSTSAFADKFIIPFSCYPKKVQARFAEHNLKLDLDPNERTEDSWGFLINEGAQYLILSYHSVTKEEFKLIILLCNRED